MQRVPSEPIISEKAKERIRLYENIRKAVKSLEGIFRIIISDEMLIRILYVDIAEECNSVSSSLNYVFDTLVKVTLRTPYAIDFEDLKRKLEIIITAV